MRTTQTFLRSPGGACLLTCLLIACSGNKEPEALPSQTVTQVTPQLEPPPPLPPPIQEVQPARSSSVRVIEPGVDTERPASLAEASALAKKAKTTAPQAVLEITDDNLHEFSQSAEIITLESAPAAPAAQLTEPNVSAPRTTNEPSSTPPIPGAAKAESYWRERALKLRRGWRSAVNQIGEYELESAALRQQFYAEEDIYIRDGQIKPAWDRVLDRLDRLRQDSERYEEDLEAFIESGRQAGVPQGWLNEGWELEPSKDERERIERFGAPHEAIDVQAVEIDEDAGP